MSEWRPIETAPKDGTRIDLWISGDDYENGGWRWTDAYWTYDGWSDDFNSITDLGQLLSDVTHWMPLTAPTVQQ